MPRLPRRLFARLFALAAGVSLLLCVASIVLWVHSLDRWDTVSWAAWSPSGQRPAAHVWWLSAGNGKVGVSRERLDYLAPSLEAVIRRQVPPGLQAGSIDLTPLRSMGALPRELEEPFALGVRRRTVPAVGQVIWEARAPAWVLVPLLAVLPAVWVSRRLKRRRRSRAGLCPVCGYDLRATHDRCPECGTVPVEHEKPAV